jgi:hypothetical protein
MKNASNGYPGAPQEELSKKLGIAAWILNAALMLGLVGLMRRVKIPAAGWSFSLSFLPPFHAAVNAVCGGGAGHRSHRGAERAGSAFTAK